MSNEDYILTHRQDDVRRLALTKAPEGIDHRWCLQQIEGWQLSRHKLPRWTETKGLWFPPRLSMEQCSSEQTALYKRSVVERLFPETERQSMADLTGGLGVDFSYLAPLFQEATYVEILPELRQLAEHNLPLLGLPKAAILPPTSYPLPPTSLLFLDPARRDTAGRKTVGIEDCTPNLLEIQDELLAHAQWVMVKLSPMLDIREALRQLHNVKELHVVSVRGECKELLFIMNASHSFDVRSGKANHTPLSLHCVNLETDDEIITYPYPPQTAKWVIPSSWEEIGGEFLYEPNTSILKAGVQDMLCERYGVQKLHPMSHLFVSKTFIPHFPGRRFQITGWSDFSKKALKSLIGDLSKANLTVRNFPTDVASLRRQLKLAEGGDTYLFATTVGDGRRILIKTQRAELSE